MPSNRVITSLAIAFGGVLGSVAALVGPKPEPTAAPKPVPFQPVSRPPAALDVNVRAEPLIPPPPTLPAAAKSTPAPAPTPSADPGPAPARDLLALEVACSRGDGRACLDAADGYRADDAERARMLTGLGVQKFAIRCMERVPVSCLELAKLHNTGRGVPRDERAANALIDHAAMLCRHNATLLGCPGAGE